MHKTIPAAKVVAIATSLTLWSPGVGLADTDTPLKGLKDLPIMQFPAAGNPCYGLQPLADEMRLNDQETKGLLAAGLAPTLPKPGSTASVRSYIEVTDNLLQMNQVNCLDKIQVAFKYFARVILEHSNQPYEAAIPLRAVETVIVGAGKDDFLKRREAAIAQMLGNLGEEWKRQNAN